MSFSGSSFLWRSGALLAAAGVTTGAFGAHGLRNRPGITPDNIRAWGNASQYAILNGIALLIISLHPRFSLHPFAGRAIAAGSVIFSGSIFALVLNRERFRFIGPITPIGGLLMISGYVALAF